MTGVEGYVESAASGLVAGINAARLIQGKEPVTFSNETAIGKDGPLHYGNKQEKLPADECKLRPVQRIGC